MGKKQQGGGGGGDPKGLLWRLPEITSNELGKIGPAFGLGLGCGAGAGIGFFGGLGFGFPGLTLGFGVGAGCGVGIGFGYGLGKGIAYDENKRYSNVGKMFQEAPNLPTLLSAAYHGCREEREKRNSLPSLLGQDLANLSVLPETICLF